MKTIDDELRTGRLSRRSFCFLGLGIAVSGAIDPRFLVADFAPPRHRILVQPDASGSPHLAWVYSYGEASDPSIFVGDHVLPMSPPTDDDVFLLV